MEFYTRQLSSNLNNLSRAQLKTKISQYMIDQYWLFSVALCIHEYLLYFNNNNKVTVKTRIYVQNYNKPGLDVNKKLGVVKNQNPRSLRSAA